VTAVVLLVALVCILTFVPPGQNDFWLQAAVGRIVLQTGDIPRTVLFPFSWAQNNAFYPHEWLPSVAFHLLVEHLGYERMVFVQGALGLLLLGLCFALAWRLTRNLGPALLFAGMAMTVANYRHYLRPELLALVLFVLELHLLTQFRLRRQRWALIGCILLGLSWANSHGSFVLGPVLAGIFALGEAIEAARRDPWPWRISTWRAALAAGAPYAAAAASMLIVSLANPLGIDVYRFVWTVSNSAVFKEGIYEWQSTFSPFFIALPGFRIFIGCVVLTLAVIVWRRRQLTATDVLLLLVFLLVASVRLRYVVWFGFVAMVVCSRLLGAAAWKPAWERAALGMTAVAGAAGLSLALAFGNAYRAYPYYTASSDLTEPMIGQLSAPGVAGNVLNSYALGAELIYRFYPRLRPSMDSRADSYGEAYFVMHNNFFLEERTLNAFVDDFGVRYMLLTWNDFELLKKMPGLRDNWKMQFADHKAVLLVRRTSGPTNAKRPLPQ
jgi:hypothetical protein